MTDKSSGSSDFNRLEEEVSKLREEVHRISESMSSVQAEGKAPSIRNIAQSLSEYVSDVVESVTSGISAEIEKSVFVDPIGARLDRHMAKAQAKPITQPEAERAASLMSAMASEHRLRILNELLYGGRYASEIEAALKELSPSTISNHLKTLQESGLVVQEADRGRYLITLPGRIALKMATRLTRFLDRRKP
jgi:DNA-binding transcriptional ArsR family regulator